MKVGIVIVSHQGIGEELLKAADSILKEQDSFRAVGVYPEDPIDLSHRKIGEAIRSVDRGQGVLILSDLFGASPSNACLPFLKAGQVELVSGMSLPMILKLLSLAQEMPLGELADFIVDYGQRHIVKGSQLI